jgi:hypothetical protein
MTLLIALVTTGAMVLVPATAGHTSDGTEYVARWQYHSAELFDFYLRVPGGLLSGVGHDSFGTRTLSGWFQDTDPNDGLCVHALFSPDNVGTGLDVCDGEGFSFDLPNTFEGELDILLTSMPTDGSDFLQQDRVSLPSTLEGALSDGDGTSWNYVSPTRASFELHVAGAHMSGTTDLEWEPSFRSVSGSMFETNPNVVCVYGSIMDRSGTQLSYPRGRNHCGGATKEFSLVQVNGHFKLTVCEARFSTEPPGFPDPCVSATIVMPL